MPALQGDLAQRSTTRRTFPADFIPGQEPSFTFTPPNTQLLEEPEEEVVPPPSLNPPSRKRAASEGQSKNLRATRRQRRGNSYLQRMPSESSLSFPGLPEDLSVSEHVDSTPLLGYSDSLSGSDSDWAELEYSMLAEEGRIISPSLKDCGMLGLEADDEMVSGTPLGDCLSEDRLSDDTHSMDTLGSERNASPNLSGVRIQSVVPDAIEEGGQASTKLEGFKSIAHHGIFGSHEDVEDLIDPASCIGDAVAMGGEAGDGLLKGDIFKGVPLLQAFDTPLEDDDFVLDDFLTCEAC